MRVNLSYSVGKAMLGIVSLIALTFKDGPKLALRPAFLGIIPLVTLAFTSLGLASIINLVNMAQVAANEGIVINAGDDLNVTLGLFGFLVPMALAISAQSLPMYAGLDAFPRKALWPLASSYIAGLALFSIATPDRLLSTDSANTIAGLGMLLIGGTLLIFIGVFLNLMRRRSRLPKRVTALAPQPLALARSYQTKVAKERGAFGPFVALIASAYLWAMLAGCFLSIDGGALLAGKALPFALDAVRHSLALGFIALLICGIAPRLITSFSGGKIPSPRSCASARSFLRRCLIRSTWQASPSMACSSGYWASVDWLSRRT